MPAFTIDLDDKGDILGELPTELQAILTRTGAEQYKVGYGKGVEQAAKEAKKQIEDTIALEKKRLEAMEPLERERVARIESENQSLASRLAELSKESDRTLKSREESHAREIVQRTEALKRRDERIFALTRGQIRMEAVQAGAREESLEELEFVLLGNYVGFDDDMLPYVKGADGQPQTVAGKPVTLQAFVRQYLDTHPHHRKVTQGRGGQAQRGASLAGGQPVQAEAIKQRINQGDRSADAINELFNATRKTASA